MRKLKLRKDREDEWLKAVRLECGREQITNNFRTSFRRTVGARDSKYLFPFIAYKYFILVSLYCIEIRRQWKRERLARTVSLVLFCRQGAAYRGCREFSSAGMRPTELAGTQGSYYLSSGCNTPLEELMPGQVPATGLAVGGWGSAAFLDMSSLALNFGVCFPPLVDLSKRMDTPAWWSEPG